MGRFELESNSFLCADSNEVEEFARINLKQVYILENDLKRYSWNSY